MKIAVIGAGAVGSLLAANITRADYELILVDRRKERSEKINARGLRVVGLGNGKRVAVRSVVDTGNLAPVDLVLLCVKAYDTASALEGHPGLVGGKTAVLSLQNGLGNLETIAKIVGPEKVLAGITTLGAMMESEGVVRHTGRGNIRIGEIAGGLTPRLETACRMFRDAGFETETSSSIKKLIWTKLIINAAINAPTAILGKPNGFLIADEAAGLLMVEAAKEALLVAAGKGVDLPFEETLEEVHRVARDTADNLSSMLMDLRRGKRTEIDHIQGAIVRLGEELGVPAPVNRTLWRLVSALEK